jgi:hypothetical protein
MENISWTDRVRIEEVIHRVKEKRNIQFLPTANSRKSDWAGHILRRSCIMKHDIEGKVRRDWKARKNT